MSEKLYNALLEGDLYTKSYDDFKSQFSTVEKQTALYENLKQDGLYTKSTGDFLDQFFPITEEQQEAEITEDVVETEQQQAEEPTEGVKVAGIPFEGETLPYEILPEVEVSGSDETSEDVKYVYRTQDGKSAWGKSTDNGETFEVVAPEDVPKEWFDDPIFKNAH